MTTKVCENVELGMSEVAQIVQSLMGLSSSKATKTVELGKVFYEQLIDIVVSRYIDRKYCEMFTALRDVLTLSNCDSFTSKYKLIYSGRVYVVTPITQPKQEEVLYSLVMKETEGVSDSINVQEGICIGNLIDVVGEIFGLNNDIVECIDYKSLIVAQCGR